MEGDDEDAKSCCSDSESTVAEELASEEQEEQPHGGSSLVELEEGSNEFVLLKHRFYTSVGGLSRNCSVVGACRALHSSPSAMARLQVFRACTEAVAATRGGDPNVAHAWYGGSKEEVRRVVRDGFGRSGMSQGQYGFGLHLYPERLTHDSVCSAPVDTDGLRHLVVCHVILGSTETILPGSTQSGPSSPSFDSGVDNQQLPSKYIVWYPDVKTNILPLYALTIKLNSSPIELQQEPSVQPTSPWMPLTTLVYVLSKFLPESTHNFIRRFHTDYMERKISRQQFIFHVRRLVGDKLLLSAIKEFQDKRTKKER